MARKPSSRVKKQDQDISDILKGFNNNILSSIRIDIKHKN